MWLMFFPLFGFWWFILFAVAFGWLILLEEYERPGEAFAVFLGFFVVTTAFGDAWRFLSWTTNHGWHMLAAIGIYLVVGFVWGIFRYWWEQSLAISNYNEKRLDFLRTNGLPNATYDTEIPDNLLDGWIGRTGIDPERHYSERRLRRYFQDNRKRIINWMSWWWLSMICFFCKDFLLRFYAIVLNRTRVIFEGIDRRVWKSASGDYTKMETRLEERRRKTEEEEAARETARRSR